MHLSKFRALILATVLSILILSAVLARGVMIYQQEQADEAKHTVLEYKPGITVPVIAPDGYSRVEFTDPIDLGGGLRINYLSIFSPKKKGDLTYTLILGFDDDRIKVLDENGVRLHFVYPRRVENVLPISAEKSPPGSIITLYDLGPVSGQYELEILPGSIQGPSGTNDGKKLDLKLEIDWN